MSEIPKYLDATDGLAAAVCHEFKSSSLISPQKTKGDNWDSYIKNNPGKVS